MAGWLDKLVSDAQATAQNPLVGAEPAQNALLSTPAAPVSRKKSKGPVFTKYEGNRDEALSKIHKLSNIQRPSPDHVENRIRDAFFKISGNPATKQVRLSAIRSEMNDIPREYVDAALHSMRDRRAAQFSTLSNYRDIQAEGDAYLPVKDQQFHTIWVNH